MTGTEIYKRNSTFDREAETIRLHAPHWKLLLAYDGQRSLAEVALSIEVAFSDALPLTQTFLDSGWIEEQPITLDQYLKRTGASSAAAAGSAVAPSVVLHEAKPEPTAALAIPAASVPSPAPAPAPVMAQEVLPTPPVLAAVPPPPLAAKAANPPPLKAAPAPSFTLPPVAVTAPPPPPVVRARGPMRLKAVVDFIVAQVGNSSLGQLVVYRVFLRVPPQLLQAEDIASVHLLNDQSVVKTDELKQAISSSVMEVVKRSLPETVFATA